MKNKLNLIVLGLILGGISFGAEPGDFELKLPYGEGTKTQPVSEWIDEHQYRIENNHTGIDNNARYIGKNFVTSNKNKEDLVQVNSKIEVVEKGISNNTTKIEGNTTNITDNNEKIVKNSENIAGNNGRLDKMKMDVDAIREDSIKKIGEIDHNSKYNKYLTEVNGRNINLVNEETEANTKKTEENKEKSETALTTAKGNTTNIAGNKENLEKNTSSITAINKELGDHKIESDKAIAQLKEQDILLKATDTKVNTAIDNLKETDAKLAQTDKELKGAVTTLEEHHDAVYETIGTTRDANAKDTRVVKADINRDRIIALEDQTKSVTVNEADISNNTTNIEGNKTNISKNTTNIERNQTNIASNRNEIYNNSERIGSLEGKVDGLETEMKKGFAMAAAMSSIDFQVLDVGDAGFGFGVGNYKNSDAVSLGVGVRPTENMTLNVKGAMSTGKGQETMVGGGAVYKFNLFGG